MCQLGIGLRDRTGGRERLTLRRRASTLQYVTESYFESDAGYANGANALGALAIGVSDLLFEAVQQGSGLDLTETTALLIVVERPGQSVTDLASALSLTHSGAVRVVDRLASSALLTRECGPDRRSIGLVVTAAGREAVDAALDSRRQALQDLLEHLSPGRRTALLEGARTLAAVLPTDRRAAHRICRLCEHDVCRGPACPVGSAVTTREAHTAKENR